MLRSVKSTELRNSLLHERRGFAPWDNGRRNKVDIVIEAINKSKDDADLDTLQDTVIEVANAKKEFKELEDSAVKMLRIHYLRLKRTPEQKQDYNERRRKALQKIKRYEQEYNLKL